MTSTEGLQSTPKPAYREVVVTLLLLAWGIGCGVWALHGVIQLGAQAAHQGRISQVAVQAAFAVCLLVMLAGSWAYLVPRLAYYRRSQTHRPMAVNKVACAITNAKPSLTVLVPAYKEERDVVWQTLMSAALQDVPGRRIVLLIDDPQHPADRQDQQALIAMRALPQDMQAAFEHVAASLRLLFGQAGAATLSEQALLLGTGHDQAAGWLFEQGAGLREGDHSARWLWEAVLHPLAREHMQHALDWRSLPSPDARALQRGWQSLLDRYTATFDVFERKRYVNLSHEPNKAMNLNAYLSLMGGHYAELQGTHGPSLVPCASDASGARHLPDSDFVLTLDADSLLLPGYASRLLEVMLRPGRERMAVIQTPYSAVPGAQTTCERIAGAQTDIQYLMHQGFTAHGATFWVGANALLRKAAIEDIATVHIEDGLRVKKYIHDRTVIEDTESSIDLVDRGWTLYNYNERLAYSATPPDFGSLLIQRRRWADGGLIILPKALRYLLRGPWSAAKGMEAFLRVHYLSSVATVNLAFLLMMFGPFEQNLQIFWIPLAMAAYMVAYARDLRHCGYGWMDFPRVYALNLMLLPVNLGGTLRSLYQALTGERAAFARTPKVVGRTAMPGGYVLAELALLAITAGLALSDLVLGHWLEAAMSGLYAALFLYGFSVFIGWRAAWEDLRLWLNPPVVAPVSAQLGTDSDQGRSLPAEDLDVGQRMDG